MSLSNNINLGPSGAIVAGNTSLNNGGLTILGGPSVTSGGGVNAGGKVISDVAAGVKDSDAVNVGQLNDVKLSAGGGWIVSDAEGYTKRIGAGDKVIFAPGNDNLTVAQKDGTVTVGLANDLDLGAVGTIKSGDTVLSNSGLRITDGPSVTAGGISAGNKVIKDVAAGKAETDAVNVGQLTGLDKSLTEKGLGLAGNSGTGHLSLGDTLAVRGEGTTAGTYSGANLRTSVGEDGSLNIAMAASPKFGSVTVNVDDSGRISGVADGVDGNDAVNKGQLDSVGAVAGRGWNVKAAGQTAEEAHNVKPGDTVSFAASNGNLTVAQKDGTVTVGLSDALTLGADGSIAMGGTTVNSDGLTIASGPSVTAGGISAGNKVIKDVAAGKAETDAVNVGQLTGLDKSLTEKGFGLAGNSGTGHLSLGDTLAVRGEGTTAGTYSGANLRTSVGEDGSLNIAMAASPKFGSVTVNVDDSGRISGVADGVDGNDAVNKGQLDSVGAVAGRGWNVKAAGQTAEEAHNVKPGDTVSFAASNGNLTVAQKDGTVTVGLSDALTLGADGSIAMGGTTVNSDGLTIASGPSVTAGGISAGNKVIKDVAAGKAETDAVNVGQLTGLDKSLTEKGFGLAGNSGTGHLSLGDTLAVRGEGTTAGTYSGANLRTSVGEDGSLNIAMAASPKFGSVTVNVDDSGRISGVADGVDGNDAVNKGQLDSVGAVAGRGWNVKAAGQTAEEAHNVKPGDTVSFAASNGNLTVAQKDGTVTVGLSDALTLGADGSIAMGGTTVNSDGLTIASGPSVTAGGISAGNKVIKDVAAGKAETDAVNVGQLTGLDKSLTEKGFGLAGNSGTGHLSLGDTLAVRGEGTTAGTYSGANLRTSVGEDGSLNIAMAASPKFGSVTVNVDDSGRISGVADGVDGNDAVNKGQLDSVGAVAGRGWNVKAAGQTAEEAHNVKPGDTVSFAASNGNLTVAQKDGTVTVGLSDALTLGADGSIAMGGTTVNSDGLTIASGPSVTAGGISAGNKVIKDVAAGKAETDAVNVGQLTGLDKSLTEKGFGLAGNSGTGHLSLGDTLAVRGEGTTAGTYSGANLRTSVGEDGSLNIAMAASPKFGSVTVNVDDSGRISGVADGVDGNDAVNKGQLDSVGAVAGRGWNVKAAGQTAEEAHNVKPGDTVSFAASNGNLTVAQKDGTVTVGLSDALTLGADGSIAMGGTTVNSDGLTIASGPSVTAGGISAGNKVIKDVAAGKAETDAVNVGQLTGLDKSLTEKGFGLAGNSGTGHLSLGDTLAVRGEGTTAGTYSGANLRTSVGEDGSLNIAMAASPKFGSVTVNVDDSGRISGVADGVDGNDAVNKGQLDSVGAVAGRGWNVKAAGQTAEEAHNVKPGDTVSFAASNGNLTVAQKDGTVTVGLSDALTLGADGSIAMGGTTVNSDGLTIASGPSVTAGGISAGNKVIKDVAAGKAETDAVNVGQLTGLDKSLTEKGFGLAGNSGTGHLSLGDTLAVRGEGTTAGTYSGANLRTSVGEDGSLNIAMAASPKFGSVTVNVDDSGRISGVADGVDGNDAVNKGQLDSVGAVAGRGWNVKAAGQTAEEAHNVKPGDTVSFAASNGNLTVAQKDGTVTVGLSDALTLGADGSIAMGGTTVNSDGLTIASGPSVTAGGISAGNKVIKDVAAGKAETDAVNVGQLTGLDKSLTEKGFGLAGNSGTGHLSLGDTLAVRGEGTTAGTYSGANLRTSVGEDGSLNIAMAASPKFGSVTVNVDDSGRISGVADGVDGNDAVNKGQLDSVGAVAGRGWNVKAAGQTAEEAHNVKPGDTVSFAASNGNLTVAQKDGTVTVGLSDALTLGADGSIAMGGTTVNSDGLTIASGPSVTAGGISAGNKVIKDVAAGKAETDAVNVGQLTGLDKSLTEKGFGLAGNSGTGHLSLGDTLAVRGEGTTAGTYSGANLRTSVGEDGSLNIAMAASPKFGSVTVNVDDSGRISGVADGVDGNDAVNKGQLDSVGAVAGRGWNVKAAGQTAEEAHNVKPGDTVSFAASNGNLTVAQKDGTVTVGLSDALTLGADGSIAMGGTTVNSDGLTIASGPSVTAGGISAGNKVIKDVAAGKAETDAVNVGQLTGLDKSLTEKGFGLAGNSGTGHLSLGDTLAVRGEGTTAGTYSGANLRTSVGEDGSLNIAMAASPKFGSVTVNVDDSGRISGVADGVDGNDAVNKGQLDSVGAVAGRGWNVKAAGQTAEEAHNVKPGDTVSFAASNGNLTVAQKDGTVTVGLSDALTLGADGSIAMGGTTVNSDGLTIASGPSVTAGGISAGNKVIKDVAAGKAETDAVNVGQLTGLDKSLTEKGFGLAGNSGTGHLSLGDTLAVRGEGTTAGTYSGANLRTSVGEDGSLNIAMAASPKFGSVTVNVDDSGRISGVADGVDGNDAVNKGQLDSVGAVAGRGWNVKAAGQTAEEAHNVKPGDTVSFAASNGNLTVAQKDGTVTVGLSDALTLGADGSIAMGGTTVNSDGLTIASGPSVTAGGISAGNKVIKDVAAGKAETDAVNVGQLTGLDKSLTEKGFGLAGNSGTGHLSLGDTLAVRGEGTTAGTYSGANLRTSVGEDGSLNIAMAASPKFGSVTVNVDDSGRISGVADGVDGNDAVNKGQLDSVGAVAGRGWNVKAAGQTAEEAHNVKPGDTVSFAASNGNLTVAQKDGTVTVGLSDALTLGADGSIAMGGTTVNSDGLTIASGPSVTAGGISAGNKVIKDVAAGKAETDAVNVGQLTGLDKSLTEKGFGLAGNSGTGHLSLGDTLAVRGEGTTAGTYSGANLRTSVGEDGSLNIAMAASPKFGSVTVNVDDSGRISGVADGVDGNDAVNKGQLDNVIEVANTGWNVSDAKGNSKKVAPGDTVTFAPSNNNLSVNQLDGIITIGLAKDLNLTDSGSVTIGNVRLNNGGLKIVNGPSITTDGIDAGGKRITNVADAIGDKDAVNYGQLKNWSGDIVNNINNNGIRYFHANSKGKDSTATGNDAIAIGPGSVASGNNAVATGNGAIASGTGTIASGNDAKASGENTIALGTNSNAIGRGSIAMGNNSSSKAEGSVSIGMESSVTENASNSIALGSYSVADRENTLSVGSKGNERQITNVADGKELTDAVNVGQLKGIESSINNIGGNVTNITEGREGMFQVNNTSKRAKPAPIGEDALAGGAGAKASGKNSVAVGNNSLASAENSVALGNNSSAKSSNSVALGTASVADRDNTISVGASGSERQITNVARGTRGTDAVNLDQLTQATDASNQYTDNKFSQLKQMVDKNKDKLSAGIAGAMAMATLPQPYSPGASMMALSGGTYQGQSAIALGVSTISDNGKWVSKLSGMSNSQGDFGVSVGVGYQW
ncbi:YadA-like family protein [Klebsiella oxytoca]|uniref:YadA-like family protein n=1 Tax=Klebsiella oxytoca TaxID=571 RepID=UPI00384AF8E7